MSRQMKISGLIFWSTLTSSVFEPRRTRSDFSVKGLLYTAAHSHQVPTRHCLSRMFTCIVYTIYVYVFLRVHSFTCTYFYTQRLTATWYLLAIVSPSHVQIYPFNFFRLPFRVCWTYIVVNAHNCVNVAVEPNGISVPSWLVRVRIFRQGPSSQISCTYVNVYRMHCMYTCTYF